MEDTSPYNHHDVETSRHGTDARHVHPTTKRDAFLWSDMVPSSWIPFVQLSRVDSIAGLLLMFWPCAWGALSSAYRTRLEIHRLALQLTLYFIGSAIFRSSICTWNDICDRKVDAQVERTKHRPLAAGKVTVPAAILFMIPQLVVVITLLSFTSSSAMKIGLFGLCTWQPIYPLLKRVTHWPQAWLGFVMNWGLLVAWTNNTGEMDRKLLSTFFFGAWCWTMYYDTTYAMQDKSDDAKAGIKSTALLFTTSARPMLSVCCTGFILALTYVGFLGKHGPAYFAITVIGTAAHLIWQIMTVDLEDPRSCFAMFDRNGRYVGLLVAGGMMADYVVKMLA